MMSIPEKMSLNPPALEGDLARLGQPVSMLNSTWYVVETRPRQERFAIENLHLQKFTTFWPRFWKTHKHARQQKTVLAPLFPGYLFVALDTHAQNWRSINGTYGVKRLVVGTNQSPQPIPHHAMNLILRRCENGIMTRMSDQLQPGDQARIYSGPLYDHLVLIEGYDAKGRVRVLMDLLGFETRVTVPESQIGPV